MRLQDYDTTRRLTARLLESHRITPDDSPDEVRELTLEVAEELRVEPGQSIGVLAPGDEALGQDVRLRLYSIASPAERTAAGGTRIQLCVRRCSYIDEYSGEEYPGRTSNYLCDLRPGDPLTLTGPFGDVFEVPQEPDATLILIGAGTGIAPFRAFVRKLYGMQPPFAGRIRLFHGARTGMELAYMNDRRDDFAQYYDLETFEAITARSHRPHWTDEIDWRGAIEPHAEELWEWLGSPSTYVYLAGIERIRDRLDEAIGEACGEPERWRRRKAELVAGKRWVELLY